MSWAMSVFCERSDFEEYHKEIGKKYNYELMREKMQREGTVEISNHRKTFGGNVDFTFLDALFNMFEGIGNLFNL
jgi:hypothetical protein